MNLTYGIIAGMALEYRLSLANLCKILGKQPTEAEQLNIYEKIKKVVNRYTLEKCDYLFFHETANESSRAALVAYTVGSNFIRRYTKAIKDGDEEKVNELKNELHKTDNDFKELKTRLHDDNLTLEDIQIISKYRIRHIYSRESFARDHELSDRTLSRLEKKLESNILKEKIEKLSDFVDMRYRKRRK